MWWTKSTDFHWGHWVESKSHSLRTRQGIRFPFPELCTEGSPWTVTLSLCEVFSSLALMHDDTEHRIWEMRESALHFIIGWLALELKSHRGWSHWGTHNIGPVSAPGLLLMLLQHSRSPFCHAENHWTRGRQSTLVSSSFLLQFNYMQLQSPPQEYSHWEESRKSLSVWAFHHSKLLSTSQWRGLYWALLCTHGYQEEKK